MSYTEQIDGFVKIRLSDLAKFGTGLSVVFKDF